MSEHEKPIPTETHLPTEFPIRQPALVISINEAKNSPQKIHGTIDLSWKRRITKIEVPENIEPPHETPTPSPQIKELADEMKRRFDEIEKSDRRIGLLLADAVNIMFDVASEKLHEIITSTNPKD